MESNMNERRSGSIDRRAAIDIIMLLIEEPEDDFNEGVRCSAKMLTTLPSVQPEQIRAKWIVTTSLQEGQITWIDYKCSNCSHHREKPMNFCEVCGAKMER